MINENSFLLETWEGDGSTTSSFTTSTSSTVLQSYDEILIMGYALSDYTSEIFDPITLTLNGDTTSTNYSTTNWQGVSTTESSASNTRNTELIIGAVSSVPLPNPSLVIFRIQKPTSTGGLNAWGYCSVPDTLIREFGMNYTPGGPLTSIGFEVTDGTYFESATKLGVYGVNHG